MYSSLVSIAALLLATASSGSADRVTSRLMIHIPHSLFKEEGYEHREALFGTPPYGGSIAQNVYYADSLFCDTGDFDSSKFYPRNNKKKIQSPFILMINRGDCTFVKKVRNAQKAGAAAVIIADNTCMCSDKACMDANSDSDEDCEFAEPIMSDDGSGGDITIPSFLMFKVDADAVKAQLKDNSTPVQMELSWSLPAPDDRVEYDLWTMPTDVISREFIMSFKNVALSLGDRAYFTPHWFIYDGGMAGCQGDYGDGEGHCGTLCTNNGRYCAIDPDGDFYSGISGADVVKESLRRLCIWKHYGDQDGVGAVWWDYVTEFVNRCSSPDYFMNEDCVRDAYKHSNVDGGYIDLCIKNSGGLDADVVNSLLDIEINNRDAQGVVVLPTAFVNTVAIRGHLSPSNIFNAICAGYSVGSTPAICNKCSQCPDVNSCLKDGRCKGGKISYGGASGRGGNVSTHTFAVSLLFVVLLFSALGVWHYKRTRDDMREQVRGILAEYMPLEDQDGPGTPGSPANPMAFAQGAGTTNLISG